MAALGSPHPFATNNHVALLQLNECGDLVPPSWQQYGKPCLAFVLHAALQAL